MTLTLIRKFFFKKVVFIPNNSYLYIMKEYDPNNPLTDQELEALPFEDALDYLDSQSHYLRSIPLPPSTRDPKIVKMMSDKGYLAKKVSE